MDNLIIARSFGRSEMSSSHYLVIPFIINSVWSTAISQSVKILKDQGLGTRNCCSRSLWNERYPPRSTNFEVRITVIEIPLIPSAKPPTKLPHRCDGFSFSHYCVVFVWVMGRVVIIFVHFSGSWVRYHWPTHPVQLICPPLVRATALTETLRPPLAVAVGLLSGSSFRPL